MQESGVSDSEALEFLAREGWLPLILGDQVGLAQAYSALQPQAAAYFACKEDDEAKVSYRAVSGAQASEQGYFQIANEKSILTIKTQEKCPLTLRQQVANVWSLTADFMANILSQIALSLGLPKDVFDPLVLPCRQLPLHEHTPTLLRMFRYDRPEGPEARVNAEPHRDLGLLSLVVGHSPGLQIRRHSQGPWIGAEDDEISTPEARARSHGLTATLLAGRTLEFLTRQQYRAGAHAVVCDPASASDGHDSFRYSMVFTLRPAEVPLFTTAFESPRVGVFDPSEQSEGENARELFRRIRQSHYNVNAAPYVRLLQKLGRA